MGWRIEIRNTGGTVVGTTWHGSFDRSYVLPDGRRFRMMDQVTAWCRDCDAFVTAEGMPTVADLDETIAALRAGPAAYHALEARRYGKPEGPANREELDRLTWFVVSVLPDWDGYREWRLLRKSPARCLGCFSTTVHPLDERGPFAVHPVTGERLKMGTTAHMSMAYHWFYTVEGLPLPAKVAVGRRR